MSLHRFGFLSLLTLLIVHECGNDGSDLTSLVNVLAQGQLSCTANGGDGNAKPEGKGPGGEKIIDAEFESK
jgi:hypothetical protein